VTKPANANKRMSILYYIHSMPPTCFGHTFSHLQGGYYKG